MGLRGFERRLEQLVEGTFAKAFRSGLQPVEVGRKVVRAIDDGRTMGLRGTMAPNDITVHLGPADFARFEGFGDALVVELGDAVRQHARDEGYRFAGPVAVRLAEDDHLGPGRTRVDAVVVAAAGAHLGALVLPDGRRHQLGDGVTTLGRVPTCTITCTDPQVSRVHAEIRPDLDGYEVVDMGSTNGTLVNGNAISAHALNDGDVIQLGNTIIRFEAS
ncbi:MAG: FhaA domain-containing protein [Acidimicrobiia bacterium]